MSLRFSFSPSGGVIYHFIAARRSRTKWTSFRAQVREWISLWRPDETSELIIFGPSAGWTLPLDLLAKSKRLTLVEPDPIARRLLAVRLRAVGARADSIEWLGDTNLLPWFTSKESKFETFLNERPHADILFSNVLGQIALHFSADQKQRAEASQQVFLKALETRRWASYHDLFSGRRRAEGPSLKTLALNEAPDVAQIFADGVVTDHETAWLAKIGVTQLATWPLTESQTHLIGFVNFCAQIANEVQRATDNDEIVRPCR